MTTISSTTAGTSRRMGSSSQTNAGNATALLWMKGDLVSCNLGFSPMPFLVLSGAGEGIELAGLCGHHASAGAVEVTLSHACR